jgi:hypothetical protein
MFQGVSPESQGRNLAVTVLHVPYSLKCDKSSSWAGRGRPPLSHAPPLSLSLTLSLRFLSHTHSLSLFLSLFTLCHTLYLSHTHSLSTLSLTHTLSHALSLSTLALSHSLTLPGGLDVDAAGGDRGPGTLHPAPYTLNPTPCTLHPEPHTLHPTP